MTRFGHSSRVFRASGVRQAGFVPALIKRRRVGLHVPTPPIGTDLSEEGSKPADLLLFGFVPIEHSSPAWFFQKLKDPRSFDQGHVAEFYDRLRMPHFGFTDEQADAVTLLLQGLTKEKMPLEIMRRLSARDVAKRFGELFIRGIATT